MFYFYPHKPVHFGIIVSSIIVFIILNTIENVIHFSIGRGDMGTSSSKIHLVKPTCQDWVRIIMIMLLFAILQGTLTYYFTKITL